MNLIEGIVYNQKSDHFDFIWTQDSPKDIINLKIQRYNKKFSIKDGNSVYYAYKFNSGIEKNLVKDLKTSIKYLDDKVSEKDVNLMIYKAVNSFNRVEPISSFDVIVTPKSASKVLDLVKNLMEEKAGKNTIVSSDVFLKRILDEIEFDEEKLSDLDPKYRAKVEKLLHKIFSQNDYKIRSVTPRFRKFIINFLKFNSELEKRTMNALVEGKVLIIDDILTEGTTVKNMVSLLEGINAKEVLSFILLASKK